MLGLLADSPVVLTVPEVALRLPCSAHIVRRLCESAQLPAFRLGANGSWRIHEADLAEFINAHERGEGRATAA